MGCKYGKLFIEENDLQDMATTSGMDPTKVQQKFDNFVRAYPNGKVSKTHFKTLMSESLLMSEALPKTKQNMEKLTNHIFRVYDSNNDGYIDFVEFMVVYHVMTQGSHEDVFGKIFRLFDVNGDGTISIQEMQRLVKDLYALVHGTTQDEISMTRKMRDGNKDEWFGTATMVFKEMDTNEDKKISKEEFISACLSNKGFTKGITLRVVDILNDIYVENNDSVVEVVWDKSEFAQCL